MYLPCLCPWSDGHKDKLFNLFISWHALFSSIVPRTDPTVRGIGRAFKLAAINQFSNKHTAVQHFIHFIWEQCSLLSCICFPWGWITMDIYLLAETNWARASVVYCVLIIECQGVLLWCWQALSSRPNWLVCSCPPKGPELNLLVMASISWLDTIPPLLSLALALSASLPRSRAVI